MYELHIERPNCCPVHVVLGSLIKAHLIYHGYNPNTQQLFSFEHSQIITFKPNMNYCTLLLYTRSYPVEGKTMSAIVKKYTKHKSSKPPYHYKHQSDMLLRCHYEFKLDIEKQRIIPGVIYGDSVTATTEILT